VVAWLPESCSRKIWLWVHQGPEPRMTVLVKASRNLQGWPTPTTWSVGCMPTAGFLLSLLFDREDVDNIFLRECRLLIASVMRTSGPIDKSSPHCYAVFTQPLQTYFKAWLKYSSSALNFLPFSSVCPDSYWCSTDFRPTWWLIAGVLFLGCVILWLWAMLLTFQKYMLCVSSGSNCVGWWVAMYAYSIFFLRHGEGNEVETDALSRPVGRVDVKKGQGNA
jgi:hypothetical protein